MEAPNTRKQRGSIVKFKFDTNGSTEHKETKRINSET